MGIVINTLHRMDSYHDQHFGTVTHNGQVLDAVIVGPFDRLRSLLHVLVTAEYELKEIISADTNLPQDDSISGIYPLADDQVVVDGSIHNVIDIDEHFSYIDIYLQNSVDFLAISSEHLGQIPSVGTRIRILGKGLHVYPTFT